MWNRRKWRSLLLLGLALLLVSSVLGCAPSYTEADLEAAREAGYSEGHATGRGEGYDEGYDKGYYAGIDEGYSKEDYNLAKALAYDNGYGNGFTDGYKAGLVQSGRETITTTESSTKTKVPTTTKADLPPGAISWDKAIDHVGERTTIYGPVVGATYASGSRGQPTFLNVGRNYPDPARFTVVIWGSNRSKFSPAPEIQYKGRTIYVKGLVEEYKGSAQIIVTSPDQIQVK